MQLESSQTPSQTSETQRQFPTVLINGVNPFYLVQTVENLFSHSELFEGERFLPLLRFQQTILILMTLYRFLSVCAPSQSGKTTGAEVIAAALAYAFPGETTLILSTIDDQAERLRTDIRDKLIKQCTVPKLRELSKDTEGVLIIKETRSKIIAVPHSIKAVTGNPARFVILDEVAKWDKDPHVIYSEAIARTGKTGGQVLDISSRFGEGRRDPKSETGFTGNFFDFNWNARFANRGNPKKDTAAVNFTYHVSPFLVKTNESNKEAMKNQPGAYEEHYLGIPRKNTGRAVFANSFKRGTHVISDQAIQSLVNPNESLFLCFDPGLTKAAVLGQLDPDAPRLLYLRNFMDIRTKRFEDFAREVVIKVRREFPGYYIQYFADAASKKVNDQTFESDLEVLSRVCGQWPVVKWQPIEPGIDIMESFMRRVDAFYVSDKCDILVEAFEGGLVCDVRNGVPVRKWKKDGHFEHPGDAARYPVYYLTGGLSVDSLFTTGAYEVEANPYVNPYTGY